jgi:hypothetical protein
MKADDLRKDFPDKNSAPVNCEYCGCDYEPDCWVLYTQPKEYVCYCSRHQQQKYNEMEKSIKWGPLL